MTVLKLLSFGGVSPEQVDELVSKGFETATNQEGDTFFECDRLYELTTPANDPMSLVMPDWFKEIYEEAIEQDCDFILLYPN